MNIIQVILEWDQLAYDLVHKGLHNPFAFYFFELITNTADISVFVLTLYWLFNLFSSNKLANKKIFHIIMPVFITAIITVILKLLIQRGQPAYLVKPWAEIPIPMLPVIYAFPSGHASRAFALATVLSAKFPKEATFFFALAVLIGFSRIYVGAHYPLDVIAGAILGVFISFLFVKFKK